MNFDIQIKVSQAELFEAAVGQAESVFRNVRNLSLCDNFKISSPKMTQ